MESQLNELVTALPFDLRAEVLVVDLMRKGFTLDDFFMQPVGLFRRRFGKDIAGIEQMEFGDGGSGLVMTLNREGVYDTLPENMFHHPPGGKPKAFKGVQEMVSDVKRRVQEEQYARRFFFIYETEFLKQRLVAEWQERKLLDTITFSMDDEEMLAYLQLPSILSKRQKGILFYLYPIIYKIRGDLKLMSAAYSVILHDRIDIRHDVEQAPPPETTDTLIPSLGSAGLSDSFVLGRSSSEVFDCFRFRVLLKDLSRISSYVPEGRNRRILEALHRYFVPVHVETRLDFLVPSHPWVVQKENPNQSRLGFGMVL